MLKIIVAVWWMEFPVEIPERGEATQDLYWQYKARNFGNESIYTGLKDAESKRFWLHFSLSWEDMTWLLCNDKRYSKPPTAIAPSVMHWSIGGLQNFHKRMRKRNAKEKAMYIDVEGSSPVLFEVGVIEPNASQSGNKEAATVGTYTKSSW